MLGKDNCTHSNHIIINDAMMHACLVLFVQTSQFDRHLFTGLILGQYTYNLCGYSTFYFLNFNQEI